MKAYGKRYWAFSGGRIPLASHGKEPEFTSHDKVAILNTSAESVKLELTIFYEHREPVCSYHCEVGAGRLMKLRFNDLIDPLAMPLEVNYGCFIQAEAPVVVQFSRMNTGSAALAECSTMAFFQQEE